MGTELIAKATDSFERKHRKCLDELEDPSLFSMVPRISIVVVANPEPGHSFSTDQDSQSYRLALVDDRVQVLSGVTVVGEITNPPKSVVDALLGPCPSLRGRVLKVFKYTGNADILLEQL
jgi:hypothetical protein